MKLGNVLNQGRIWAQIEFKHYKGSTGLLSVLSIRPESKAFVH